MNKKDFYYFLPEELIAQSPLLDRSSSRLMCLDKKNGTISHQHFYEIINLLNPGDTLVINDSRVLPARLMGQLQGGGICEVLLLRDLGENTWECIVRPGKKLKKGAPVNFGEGLLKGQVISVEESGNRIIQFECKGIFLEVLDTLGTMPLPPYIHEKLEDKERYQTVYSKELGSAAAPTAGLHFTKELLSEIEKKGVSIVSVTLHVGLGTFRPVKADNILEHEMHAEFYILPEETVRVIKGTKQRGGRVISVGTTSTRVLEGVASTYGELVPSSGFINIFIYPGFEFKVIDGLITNFHLPESTLIMLVSALCGREAVLHAYEEAIREKYRFFSFGDAMFIN